MKISSRPTKDFSTKIPKHNSVSVFLLSSRYHRSLTSLVLDINIPDYRSIGLASLSRRNSVAHAFRRVRNRSSSTEYGIILQNNQARESDCTRRYDLGRSDRQVDIASEG